MAALNNIATTDTYTDASTLRLPGVSVVSVIGTNASFFYQLALNRQGVAYGGEQWEPEVFAPPSRITFGQEDFYNGKCVGIRFRSGTAGVPARVTASG